MSHDESDLLGLFVSHESSVSSSTLLELLISDSVELSSHLEDALLTFLASNFLHLWKGSLHKYYDSMVKSI